MVDAAPTILPMTHTNVRPYRALRPDPRGRNAIDLPFTTAQAAALARVLDEIRTGTAGTDRDRWPCGRNAGGATSVRRGAPPATPNVGHFGRNISSFSISGNSPPTSA